MKSLALSTLFSILALCSFAQTSLEQMSLPAGNYEVGFKHYVTSDASRTYNRRYEWSNQHIARPMHIGVWYPAQPGQNASAMTVLDYMEILKIEEEWEHLPNEFILNWFYYANTPENQKHMKETTTAIRNARPADGKFPVIIYAPSLHAVSIENFSLCEYLASQGYLVISSTSRGGSNRYFDRNDVKTMEVQARDIDFLMEEVSTYPNADLDRMATMGFSFGGLSNVLAQIRNAKLKAIVSLDGSIRYQFDTLQLSPFFDINQVDVPFIHMAQKRIPERVMKEDQLDPALNDAFPFYDSLVNSDAYKLKFHDLTHGYFSTLGVLFQTRDPRQDKSDALIMESYKWMSLYTLNFLNAHLRKDKKALQFLINTPEQNAIPSERISSTFKKSQSQPFDFRDFNDLAMAEDYKDLIGFYERIKAKHPHFKPQEGALNHLGLQYVFNPQRSQLGIEVFKLALHLYPNSANLYDSLAEGYLFIGETKNAVAAFKKSLELNPQNQNAIQRLEQLGE